MVIFQSYGAVPKDFQMRIVNPPSPNIYPGMVIHLSPRNEQPGGI